MTHAIKIVAASLCLAVSAVGGQNAPSQPVGATGASAAFLRDLLEATEGTALARARQGIRYLDVHRTAQVLASEFADSLTLDDLRGALPENYRDLQTDDSRDCPARPARCPTRESAVIVVLADLQASRNEIRTSVVWRDNARRREQGMGVIEWEVVFHRAGDRWVLASHRVRRMA